MNPSKKMQNGKKMQKEICLASEAREARRSLEKLGKARASQSFPEIFKITLIESCSEFEF